MRNNKKTITNLVFICLLAVIMMANTVYIPEDIVKAALNTKEEFVVDKDLLKQNSKKIEITYNILDDISYSFEKLEERYELIKEQKAKEEARLRKYSIPELVPYTAGVKEGTVRYVSQTENLEDNGWIYKKDGRIYDFTSIANGECALCSSCMALSYLGIDIGPGEFAYNCGQGALYFTTRWAEWRDDVSVRKTSGTEWEDYYRDYKDDNEYKYSPVIIQITNYCYTNSHYVVVVGKNKNGTYKVYDCYENAQWDATIKNGHVYGLGGKANGSIGQVCQYIKTLGN